MALKLVIVGGVAVGATTAARARRLDEEAEIVEFERGEHISFANCGLPYYIGQVIKKRDRLLVTTAEALRARYNIDVRNFSEATGIDRQNKQISVKNLHTGETYTERATQTDFISRCGTHQTANARHRSGYGFQYPQHTRYRPHQGLYRRSFA